MDIEAELEEIRKLAAFIRDLYFWPSWWAEQPQWGWAQDPADRCKATDFERAEEMARHVSFAQDLAARIVRKLDGIKLAGTESI